MKNLIAILSIIITLTSCKSTSEDDNSVYFGGQIVNPKTKYVVLMKGEKSLDTIQLKSNNTFSKKLESLPEGLYSFKHGPEFQYVYFQEKDSISIRLNTWDFDESLVYNGKGSEKNNFLINLFLQNEKNQSSFSPFYNLNTEEFSKKIELTKSANQHFYEQLVSSGVELTPKFNELAEVAVNFPLFRQKEIYPYIHKNRFQLDSFPELPKNYYEYRKNIDLNNDELIDYYSYQNYVTSFLYSQVYTHRDKSVSFTEQILREIIKHISIDKFKNHLLYQAIYNDFRESEPSCSFNNKALKIFNNHCTDEYYIKRINILADDCKKIRSKKPLENFSISTYNNLKTDIKSVIKNRKSVIYFWTPEMMNQDMLIKRIKRLNEKHPDLLFVGVNMKPLFKNHKIAKSLENQYILTKNSSANTFLKSLEPRTILVDNKGIITNSFTYLSSQHLEKQLESLEKSK